MFGIVVALRVNPRTGGGYLLSLCMVRVLFVERAWKFWHSSYSPVMKYGAGICRVGFNWSLESISACWAMTSRLLSPRLPARLEVGAARFPELP